MHFDLMSTQPYRLLMIFLYSSSVKAREVCVVIFPWEIVESIAFAIASSLGASAINTKSWLPVVR